MIRVNIFFVIVLFYSCNTPDNGKKIEFQGMDPEKGVKGIGITSDAQDAFLPGFNIRVYCNYCNVITNTNYGFKGSLGDYQGECFDYSSCFGLSKCYKCQKEAGDHPKKIVLHDVVFSRCNYEWRGTLWEPYKGKSDSIIFRNSAKTSFHTVVFKLDKPSEYMMYDKDQFINYQFLTIRCVPIQKKLLQ